MITHTLALPGCTPEPLMNYLKALGVLRLLSDRDGGARGSWENAEFVLRSTLTREELIVFFRDDYEPSPILAPWGARSGFYEGKSERSARDALNKIVASPALRFRRFANGVTQIRAMLGDLGISAKAKDAEKIALLGECRSRLDDAMLPWLDACYVLTEAGRKFPPIFGTGGNEGSGSYVSGFAQQVVACVVDRAHDEAIETALFGTAKPGATSAQTPGHFSPSAAGGANSTQGLEGGTTTNPWDYLLAIEGACLWASGIARKLGQAGSQVASFPFTVNVSGVGSTSLAMKDGRRPKAAKRDIAELWLPLWDRLLSVSELSALLAEGRASIGRRVADSGLDFARAATGLGVDRGITAFQRTAFLMRNGQSFMSIPLGRVDVRGKKNVGLLREPAFERWLARFRRACGEKAPPRFASALRQIERAIFDFCRYGRDNSEHSGGDPFLQAVLIALGQAEAAIASAPGFRTNRKTGRAIILPLAGLSADWIAAADDGSAEYEIALALAGIGGAAGRRCLRRNLEPFTIEKRRAAWAEKDRAVVWNAADLSTNLGAVLARRLMDGERHGNGATPRDESVHPLESVDAASLEAVASFLTPGALDDKRIADLLWGLMLIDTSRQTYRGRGAREKAAPLSRAYALLKLLALPFALAGEESDVDLALEPALLALLRGGRVGEACAIAARRLRAKGFLAMPHRRAGGGEQAWAELPRSEADGRRIAAALLIPISYRSALALRERVLRPRERESQFL